MATEIDEKIRAELIKCLRMQRHDFINHLQVLHAMLQLGKLDKALTYIESLSKDIDLVNDYVKDYSTDSYKQKA